MTQVYRDYDDNPITCPHGILWSFDCEKCDEEEHSSFFRKLFRMIGGGDEKAGRDWFKEKLDTID